MTNGLTRGIPVQDQPENQDPSVAHTVDEMTGAITPFEEVREKGTKTPEDAAPKPKRRGRPPKPKPEGAEAVTPAADPGDEEETDPDGEDAEAEKAADPTSLREVGS